MRFFLRRRALSQPGELHQVMIERHRRREVLGELGGGLLLFAGLGFIAWCAFAMGGGR
jgi:hypothetical protein